MKNTSTHSNFEKSDFSFSKLNIKLLGDSITHGVGGTGFCQNGEPIADEFRRNPDGFCWAKLFKEHLETNYSAKVINNACTGTKIEFIIKNFNLLVSDDDNLIICTIGTNNRHQYMKDGPKRSREEIGEEFYNNILKLNDLFVNKSKKVIFIANIPASNQNEQDGADYWRILHMNDINDIYKQACKKAGFAFISMYDLFLSYIENNGIELDTLLRDGLHPNDDGYKAMYTILKNELGF